MRFISLAIMATIILSACANEPRQRPVLPEGVETVEYTINGESLRRGVKGSYNTSPQGRPAAILDVVYKIRCIAENSEQRLANVKAIFDEKYVIAPIIYISQSDDRAWTNHAGDAIDGTGCILIGRDAVVKTTDPIETIYWALSNQASTRK